MPAEKHLKTLGLKTGSSEKEIKSAYRKLAFKYHPDRNRSAGASRKFQEITHAYEYLLKHYQEVSSAVPTPEERMAREVYQREKARMYRQVRTRMEQRKKEQDYFNRPEWHDPLLFLRYTLHIGTLFFAVAAVIAPVSIAIFVDPASLAGTFFFLVVGVFLLIYIYQKRHTWFRLGSFTTRWKDIWSRLFIRPGNQTRERCCFAEKAPADGKPYRMELLMTIDIKIQSFGVLNHDAKYKNKVKKVVIPRSVRAQLIHRITSFLKILSIIASLWLFPVDSILWRFITGLLAGGVLSGLLLLLTGVKSRVSYLFTPGLIIKAAVWLLALWLISSTGPGFNIEISGYVYIMVAGLFFFLDMIFDLVLGFFPFYAWLFRPLVKQGAVLDSLYRQGYRNYMELPVYSVVFPLYRYIF